MRQSWQCEAFLVTRTVDCADMGNEQSSPLQQAAAHDDIDKVHALLAQNRIELNGTDKVNTALRALVGGAVSVS